MKYLRKTHRQYISNTRIGKTRQLLVESNLSVMEVAVVSRFNSSANISKLFRTKFGVSPGRLRTGR